MVPGHFSFPCILAGNKEREWGYDGDQLGDKVTGTGKRRLKQRYSNEMMYVLSLIHI